MAVPDLRALGARFVLPGRLVDARRHGNGHINDTYAATYDEAGRQVRYVHQRINDRVFRQPERLMENVARVLAHAATRITASIGRARISIGRARSSR